MSHKHALVAELQVEAANTRKMLERVPVEKNDWQPHAKSMKLGNLSSHIAQLPGWITMIMTTDELNLATMDYKPMIAQSTEELTGLHDQKLNEAITTLENSSEEDFDKMWTLRRGDHVIFALPKKVVIRSMAISHLVHHRGQISVYLRLLDVPVPGMYGPSRDDVAFMAPVEEKMEASAN